LSFCSKSVAFRLRAELVRIAGGAEIGGRRAADGVCGIGRHPLIGDRLNNILALVARGDRRGFGLLNARRLGFWRVGFCRRLDRLVRRDRDRLRRFRRRRRLYA
jgi:hypothetical protein